MNYNFSQKVVKNNFKKPQFEKILRFKNNYKNLKKKKKKLRNYKIN